jgi:DinB superfamily
MPEVAQPDVAEAVATLLRETFEGPSGASTYFIDNDPRAGLLPAIEALTSAQASLSPWPKAPSIAGHVHHIAFHLEMSAAWLRGDREDRDWSRSWIVREVDGEAWDPVRAEVRRRYEDLLRAIESEPAAFGDALPTAIGAVAHAAYHLGAIRQRIAAAAAA